MTTVRATAGIPDANAPRRSDCWTWIYGIGLVLAPIIVFWPELIGTQVFSGANAYNGATTISAGTLQLAGAGTIGGGNSALTVNTGGTLDLNGTNQKVGNFTGTGGKIFQISDALGRTV